MIKQKNYLAYLIILLLFSYGVSYGQSATISGVVTSREDQMPLTGVSVLVKGTSIGAVTDFDGKFSLKVEQQKPILIFSYLGFKKLEIVIDNETAINVVMETDTSQLDEVVLIGYGTQKRKDLTGSVSSIKGDELENLPLRSADQALQGRSAGVFTVQSSGAPGAASSIRIRGGNSINGSNEPLFVVDGVPISSGSSSSAASLNPLNTINPTDIASIEILKDASATSIYGSRGGNGVVLITTKRGKSGKGSVSLSLYYGFQKETNRYDLLNAKQYETLANEASLAEGGGVLYDPSLNPVSTDWQEAMLNNIAPVRNFNVSATGGKEGTNYLLSFDYFNQEGIVKSSDIERYSLRSNIDSNINDFIKVGGSLTGSYVEANRVNSGALSSMLTTAPNLPIKQPDGSFTQFNNLGIGFNNPVGLLYEYKNLNKNFRTLGNVYVSAELAKGLTVKTTWGIDASFQKNDTYIPQSLYTGSLVGGDASVYNSMSLTWLNENTINYKVKFHNHSLDALFGFTQQSSRFESTGASATGFLNDVTTTYALGLGNPEAAELPSSASANWTIHSYIGRINYGLNDKYLLTLTTRVDGSSRFGANNRYGFFPSAALAWKAIEEDFVRDLNVFSNLKIRASYGITGNQDGIGNNPSLDLWGGTRYVIGDMIVNGITPTQVPNNDLKWETTDQYDFGLEFGFFDNRLTFLADAYYKITDDLLLNVTIPNTSGFQSGLKNIGSIENKGLEFTVDAAIIDDVFKWDFNFNITFNKNKIINLGGEDEIIPSGSNTILKVDESLGTFYGYVSDGLFQSPEEIIGSAQPTAKPGDVRFVDFDNNGIINEEDQQIIGNAQPEFFGGINNTFSYKGFELSVLFQYVYGNDLYNLNVVTLENLTGLQNQRTTVLDRWTVDNTNTNIPRATTTRPVNRPFDRYVEDGSYLRMKNIQLAYNFPETLVSELGVQNLRIYANAQNFLTITDYSGLDPEVSRYGSDNIRQGFDSGAYPNSKMFSLGLNVTF
ncbi:TonB-dependent receptor [Seonamhaeicola sp. NFXS20]|uniref:SusC/RagA family TonB-linked outer membrane protein n=1 Tax=Seonamhaeicola sp. NFXS20 TaxID=2816959 RepID=UPI003B8AFFED